MTDDTDVISECYFEDTKAWRAEIDRQLREHLARRHARGEPDPPQDEVHRLWLALALDLYQPTGKPQ